MSGELTPPGARDLGPVHEPPELRVDATASRWRGRDADERDALELANGRDPLVRRLNGCALWIGALALLAFVLAALARG